MTEQAPTQQKTDIKLIVVDIDNTLLNSKHELSERNEKTIKAAIERGVQVMLATGKAYESARDLIKRLGLTVPGIFTQGLTVYDSGGNLRHQQTLDPDIARRVITYAEDRGFAVVGYAQGRLLARASSPYVEELHTKWNDSKPEYVGPLQNMLGVIQFNKICALSPGDERKIRALRWQLNTQINSSARLMSGGVATMLEILPPGASKGKALRALLKEMHIDPANVMAIGDAENDIEMVQLAGVGVAMGNADKELKAVAAYVTASNDDDGVAKAIEKYVLGTDETATEAASVSVVDPLEATAVTTPKLEDTPAEDDSSAEPSAPRPEDAVPDSDE